jgi:hypothetical protein
MTDDIIFGGPTEKDSSEYFHRKKETRLSESFRPGLPDGACTRVPKNPNLGIHILEGLGTENAVIYYDQKVFLYIL